MTEDALEGKAFPFGHFYNSNMKSYNLWVVNIARIVNAVQVTL